MNTGGTKRRLEIDEITHPSQKLKMTEEPSTLKLPFELIFKIISMTFEPSCFKKSLFLITLLSKGTDSFVDSYWDLLATKEHLCMSWSTIKNPVSKRCCYLYGKFLEYSIEFVSLLKNNESCQKNIKTFKKNFLKKIPFSLPIYLTDYVSNYSTLLDKNNASCFSNPLPSSFKNLENVAGNTLLTGLFYLTEYSKQIQQNSSNDHHSLLDSPLSSLLKAVEEGVLGVSYLAIKILSSPNRLPHSFEANFINKIALASAKKGDYKGMDEALVSINNADTQQLDILKEHPSPYLIYFSTLGSSDFSKESIAFLLARIKEYKNPSLIPRDFFMTLRPYLMIHTTEQVTIVEELKKHYQNQKNDEQENIFYERMMIEKKKFEMVLKIKHALKGRSPISDFFHNDPQRLDLFPFDKHEVCADLLLIDFLLNMALIYEEKISPEFHMQAATIKAYANQFPQAFNHFVQGFRGYQENIPDVEWEILTIIARNLSLRDFFSTPLDHYLENLSKKMWVQLMTIYDELEDNFTREKTFCLSHLLKLSHENSFSTKECLTISNDLFAGIKTDTGDQQASSLAEEEEESDLLFDDIERNINYQEESNKWLKKAITHYRTHQDLEPKEYLKEIASLLFTTNDNKCYQESKIIIEEILGEFLFVRKTSSDIFLIPKYFWREFLTVYLEDSFDDLRRTFSETLKSYGNKRMQGDVLAKLCDYIISHPQYEQKFSKKELVGWMTNAIQFYRDDSDNPDFQVPQWIKEVAEKIKRIYGIETLA